MFRCYWIILFWCIKHRLITTYIYSYVFIQHKCLFFLQDQKTLKRHSLFSRLYVNIVLTGGVTISEGQCSGGFWDYLPRDSGSGCKTGRIIVLYQRQRCGLIADNSHSTMYVINIGCHFLNIPPLVSIVYCMTLMTLSLCRMSTLCSPLAAVCQVTSTPDKDANFSSCKRLVEEAKERGASMVFMPEGFDYIGSSREETLSLSESLTGDTISRYAQLARYIQI